MIIVKLKGGFGNQMFQYAIGKALALKNNTELMLDLSYLERMGVGYVKRDYNANEHINYELSFLNVNNIFAPKKFIPFYERFQNKYINFIMKIIAKYLKSKNHLLEKDFNFNPDILEIKGGYLEGYFQTEKYFINYKNEIKKDFTFFHKPSKKNQEMIEIITNCNSVSIHVRRGDYVNNNVTNQIHGTCDLNYYEKSIKLINEKIDSPTFFMFSDDIEWVKENLKIKNKTYYIDWNNSNTCYEDMRLMSLCKHNIIANSSFSWWGAWLNDNENKIVIAPDKWFNDTNINYSDIVSESWIKI